ncbi:MAG: glycosyltransferase [Syntrophobacteraceae bacterium]
MMTIPRIIHQTWKTGKLPNAFREFRDSWLRCHPDWEYRFYDDAACRRLVANFFPQLLTIYDCCPHPVQRADIFRYLAVALNGGVYADMDMECLRNLEPVLDGEKAVFSVEDRLSPRRTRQLKHRYSERIANFIFAAEPGHPIFQKIIEALQQLSSRTDLAGEILDTTGPGMLTDVVQENRDRLGLTILPRICLAPPSRGYPNCFPFNLHMYARHHFFGTWKGSCRPANASAGWLDPRNWHPGELWYKVPPSPIWKSDFFFWLKKKAR